MSNAPNYTPTISFATEETNSVAGRSTLRTTAVDNELANISSSINGLNTNIQKLQRDDGKLKDAVIEPYALSEQARALIASGGKPRGNWAQNTAYTVGDAVQYSSTAYLCVTAHNSGTVFSSALWLPISGDGASFTYANQAAASASAASTSASGASNSATNAATSATNASNSATAASNSATNAANSATTAANVIASSIAGASQAEAEAGTDNSKYMSALRVWQAITKYLLNIATPPVNDNSNKAANTAWVTGRGIGLAGIIQYTTSTTLNPTDIGKLSYLNSASNQTLTLPAVSSVPVNSIITLINIIGTGSWTIQRTIPNTIFAMGQDSATSFVLAPKSSIQLTTDGNNWIQVTGSNMNLLQANLTGYSAGVNYQAATDGFVFGRCLSSGSAMSLTIYSDASPTPTTVLQECGTNTTVNNYWIPFCVPIKKGEWWRVVMGAGSIPTVYFRPMGV